VSRRRRSIPLTILLAAAAGCAPQPLRPHQFYDPDLCAIRDRYVEVVRDALNDPDVAWHAGPVGNVVVNHARPDHLGLCYDWQELVYEQLLPIVDERGWRMIGIKINEDTDHEHHAVVVFDPYQVRADAILASPETAPAWVLEPWRRGRADVYLVRDWLDLAWRRDVPPALERLPYEPDD
jgi:hypothetical protein